MHNQDMHAQPAAVECTVNHSPDPSGRPRSAPGLSPILRRYLARPAPTRQENVALARAILAAEVDAWRVVLSADPGVAAEVVAAHLPPHRATAIAGWFSAVRRPRARRALAEQVDAASRALPDLDPDARALDACLADMRLWGVPGVAAAAAALRRAVSRMEAANLRLVVNCAARVARRRHAPAFSLDDLVAHGAEGLRTSIMRYRPDRGTAFITVAHRWVMQSMQRAVDNLGREIRIPVHTLQAVRRLACATSVYRAEPLDDDALADAARIGRGRLAAIREALVGPASRLVSLDAPGRPHDDGRSSSAAPSFADVTPDDAPSPLDVLVEFERFSGLRSLLACLSEREAAAIAWYYNLDDAVDGEASLREIGTVLGCSGERVRQIVAEALDKMRRRAAAMGIESDPQRLH